MEKIVLRLYEDGSYGKIIRFDFQSREQVICYKEIIDKMINGQVDSVCFNDLDIIDAKTDALISLATSKWSWSFIEKKKSKGTVALMMYQDREELITHACLLEPFIEEDAAGSQNIYFNEYNYFNKYTVLLSFKEYNPRTERNIL